MYYRRKLQSRYTCPILVSTWPLQLAYSGDTYSAGTDDGAGRWVRGSR